MFAGGTIIAEVQETQAIVHKSMVPPDISGTVLEVATDGEYTINEPIVTVQLADGTEEKLTLAQKWPIRVPRPTAATFRGKQTADHRTAYPRYSVPDRQRRYCRYPGRIRYRKDHDPASDRQMVRRGYHHLYRLR